jgi:hypothetical protein
MDSVFYIPDPMDPTTMVNIVTYHSKVNIDHVSTFIKTLTNEPDPTKPKYDDYDLENLTNSRTYLENILDIDLLNDIRSVTNESTTGPEIWLRIVAEVQSTSMERLRTIENKICYKFLPNAYPNENIKLLVKDIHDACHELEVADVLPIDIIATIVNNFTKSSVDAFRHNFFNRRSDVNRFLKKARGKDKAMIALMPDKITFSDLCDEAQDEYQSLLETSLWPPSATSGDKGDAPQGLVAKTLKLSKDSPNKTFNNYSTSNDGTITCRYCKKVGHSKENCLKLKKKNAKEGVQEPTSAAATTTSNPSVKPDNTSNDTWKTTPPAKGSPSSISKEGKTWHWCAKCLSWRVSHGTDGHKSNDELAQQRAQQANVATPSLMPTSGPSMSGW